MLLHLQVQHETGSWTDLQNQLHHHRIALFSAAMDDEAENFRPDTQLAKFSDVGDVLDRLEQAKIALVLGSEGRGVRPEILLNSQTISVPMAQSMDSMNVAAAGSMIMLALSQRALLGVLTQVSRHVGRL